MTVTTKAKAALLAVAACLIWAAPIPATSAQGAPAGLGWVTAPVAAPVGNMSHYFLSTGNMTCLSTTDCVVAGYLEDLSSYPETYRGVIWHWGGSSWSLQPTGVSGSVGLVGTACTGATNCWTVGTHFTGPKLATSNGLIEHYNGKGWAPSGIPEPTGAAFNGVYCPSASDCIAVGNRQTSTRSASALVYVWHGESWAKVPAPSPPGALWTVLTSVECSGASNCVALGDADNSQKGSGYFFQERFDGNSWALAGMPSSGKFDMGNQTGLYGLSCGDANSCLAVGGALDYTNGKMGATFPYAVADTWDGSSWSPASVPSGKFLGFLEDDSCVAPGNCWASAGFDGIIGYDHPLLLLHWIGGHFSVTTLSIKGFLTAIDCLKATSGTWCAGLGETASASNQLSMAGGHFTAR
jgi:hypothetical protein